MRKTKIVCTLGPATDPKGVIEDIIKKGMNVARYNFSHGTHDEHLVRINDIKKLRDELETPVALLLDTKGPEIRIKKFKEGKVTLKKGDFFTLTTRDIEGDDKQVSVTYENLPEDVNRGNNILIDDGLIELKVINKNKTDVECEILNGGDISNRKGVNIPGVRINLPFVSDRDKEDLLFGIKNNMDFVAASFVRTSVDVKELRLFLDENGGESIQIISKIENRDGVDNIDDIIRVSNGIMVARGDMGVEIPFEELPAIQKSIIKKTYEAGKPVITATQMLDSMIRNPRPTRAEITDVANAIYDGTSAIMLSGETSIGKYPVDAVKTMSLIANETEKNTDYVHRFQTLYDPVSRNVTRAISHATCTSAHSLGAAAIITVTKSGHTARMVSRYRPECPIIAATISTKSYFQLAIAWGVLPVLSTKVSSSDEVFNQAIKRASLTDIVKDGDLVVITGGMPVGVSGTTNTIRIHILGDVLIKGKGHNNLKAEGSICIIENINDIKDFSAGDILVISKTTDEVLPIIKNAAAVITEEGEDSPAVIACKTMEIPIITSAPDATQRLKSGIIAIVDSSTGMVFNGMKY
jgi:pyruvate kinase